MDNTFDIENHDFYKDILQKIDVPFIDTELKKSKLWKLIGDDKFVKMEQDVFKSDDLNKIYMRYTRQFGIPFTIKARKIDLEKYDPLCKNTIVDHYAVHFDNKGEIFHFCPDGVHHGGKEYNKELCSDEWKIIDINDSKPFFTLMSIDEIESFCNKWDAKIKHHLDGYNSNVFASVLAFWLN